MFEAGILNGLTRISVEIGSSRSRSDDDFTDRLNHSYTTTILMLCTLIVLSRQFIGKPMSCWTPNEFTGAQVEYATLACWATSTYFISPKQAQIPTDLTQRRKHGVHYYQWVPFMLMFQAAMFSVPCIVWRLFHWQSRIHLWTVMDLATRISDIKEPIQSRSNHLLLVVRHLEDALAMRHRRKLRRARNSSASPLVFPNSPPGTFLLERSAPKDSAATTPRPTSSEWYRTVPFTVSHRSRVPGPRPCIPRSSSYLIGLYLIVKVLYIFNSTGQLFLVTRFLGQPTIFYGFHMTMDLLRGQEWFATGHFPRVTFCDFDMRRMGSNYHRHTLQCVIGMNMFNEKIFIFLWFWLMCVSVLNMNSFLRWCCRSTFHTSRINFIRGLLADRQQFEPFSSSSAYSSSTEKQSHTDDSNKPGHYSKVPSGPDPDEKKATAIFTEHVLGQDGVFVLRIISSNTGRQVASHILEQIWQRYRTATGTPPPLQPFPMRSGRPQLSKLYIPPIPTRRPVASTSGQPQRAEDDEGYSTGRRIETVQLRPKAYQRGHSSETFSSSVDSTLEPDIQLVSYPHGVV